MPRARRIGVARTVVGCCLRCPCSFLFVARCSGEWKCSDRYTRPGHHAHRFGNLSHHAAVQPGSLGGGHAKAMSKPNVVGSCIVHTLGPSPLSTHCSPIQARSANMFKAPTSSLVAVPGLCSSRAVQKATPEKPHIINTTTIQPNHPYEVPRSQPLFGFHHFCTRPGHPCAVQGTSFCDNIDRASGLNCIGYQV